MCQNWQTFVASCSTDMISVFFYNCSTENSKIVIQNFKNMDGGQKKQNFFGKFSYPVLFLLFFDICGGREQTLYLYKPYLYFLYFKYYFVLFN